MVVLGRGRPGDKAYLALETKKGNVIPNEQRMEMAPVVLKESIKIWGKAKPNAILRSITATYNCIGLVFASRRTWIDTDELNMIFTDDEYKKIDNPKDVAVGDVAVYFYRGKVSHVGIVIEKRLSLYLESNIIMSKWGAEGEYIHDVGHVPVNYGEVVEYWTDRKGVK